MMGCIEMPGALQASGRRRRRDCDVSPRLCRAVSWVVFAAHCDGVAVSLGVFLGPSARRIFDVAGRISDFDMGPVEAPWFLVDEQWLALLPAFSI